jgi:hypothetical protein
MSIKIKVSLPLGIEEKTTGFKIIILLLTIFDGIKGCRRNGLSEQWAVGIMGRRSNGLSE